MAQHQYTVPFTKMSYSNFCFFIRLFITDYNSFYKMKVAAFIYVVVLCITINGGDAYEYGEHGSVVGCRHFTSILSSKYFASFEK